MKETYFLKNIVILTFVKSLFMWQIEKNMSMGLGIKKSNMKPGKIG